MEYMPYGDLAGYIKSTPGEQRQSRTITEQLLAGLSVLHSRQICHRDLKPQVRRPNTPMRIAVTDPASQNVLIASLAPLNVKLADFGISKSTIGTDLRTRIGTAHYMAPELLGLLPLSLRLGNAYTFAVDMWALGFMTHELLTGKTPFLEIPIETISSGGITVDAGPTTDMQLLLLFCNGSTGFPRELLDSARLSDCAIQFIESLIVPDPRTRSSAAQALLHPWITGQLPHAAPDAQVGTHDLQVNRGQRSFEHMEPSRSELRRDAAPGSPARSPSYILSRRTQTWRSRLSRWTWRSRPLPAPASLDQSPRGIDHILSKLSLPGTTRWSSKKNGATEAEKELPASMTGLSLGDGHESWETSARSSETEMGREVDEVEEVEEVDARRAGTYLRRESTAESSGLDLWQLDQRLNALLGSETCTG